MHPGVSEPILDRRSNSRALRLQTLILTAIAAMHPSCVPAAATRSVAAAPASVVVVRPKLLVLVVLDQFPQWALDARTDELAPSGFLRGRAAASARLRGEYPYAATMTAVGHATLVTGVLPQVHGVFANGVYLDAAQKEIGVFAGGNKLMLADGVSAQPAAGPQLLRLPTVFDELKQAGRLGRIIAVSQKNRGAIALGGRSATIAVWQHGETPEWASSTYYGAALPAWATPPAISGEATEVASVDALFDLAEAALGTEGLGHRELTDVLAISVSSLDWAGHEHGTESPQYLAVLQAADRRLEALVAKLTTIHKFAPGEVVLVVTSDHGAAPLPETAPTMTRPAAWSHGALPPRHEASVAAASAGRFLEDAVVKELDAVVDAQRGAGAWVVAASPPYLYLGRDAEALAPAAREALVQQLLASLRQMPGVWRAYAVSDKGVVLPNAPGDALDVLVQNSVAPALAGDVYLVLSPYYIFGSDYDHGTHHGTPWDYDRQVPVIVWPASALPPRTGDAGALPMTDLAGLMRRMVTAATPW